MYISRMKKNIKERQEMKMQFGGKCQFCGYSRCQRALQFHHVDPAEKYLWSDTGGASLKEVEAHPERFKLLCSNCHIEAHEAIDAAKRLFRICPMCEIRFRYKRDPKRPNRDKYCSSKCAHKARPITAQDFEVLSKRFNKYIRNEGECIIWCGYIQPNGQPVMNITDPDGRHYIKTAVHVAYKLETGDWPKLRARFKWACGNHLCVRIHPDHALPKFPD